MQANDSSTVVRSMEHGIVNKCCPVMIRSKSNEQGRVTHESGGEKKGAKRNYSSEFCDTATASL